MPDSDPEPPTRKERATEEGKEGEESRADIA